MLAHFAFQVDILSCTMSTLFKCDCDLFYIDIEGQGLCYVPVHT